MTDSPKDELVMQGPAPQTDETSAPPSTGRRLFIFNTIASTVALVAATTAGTSTPAEAQTYYRRGTDNDPYDPRGGGRIRRYYRRRVTDNDPYDAEGRGRGYRRYRRRRVTDNDPNDPRGGGRGY